MNILKYTDLVVPEKYRKGNYVPQEFDATLVELDPTKTDRTRFIGLTKPNDELKLPVQEFVIVQLSSMVTKSPVTGKKLAGGDTEVLSIRPMTFFARRDQQIFDDIAIEVGNWANAKTQEEKDKILEKLPTQKRFTRFNGKNVADTPEALKNIYLVKQLAIPGNLISFPVPQGFYLINIDANGNRVKALERKTDWQGKLIKSNKEMIIYNSVTFVKKGTSPNQAVITHINSLPLVVSIDDYLKEGETAEKMSTEEITDTLLGTDDAVLEATGTE